MPRSVPDADRSVIYEFAMDRAAVAAQLKRRLADIQAVETIDELPMAKPKKNSNNCIIDLSGDCRLVATAGHAEIPTLSSGRIDWANVKRLKLLRIETSK